MNNIFSPTNRIIELLILPSRRFFKMSEMNPHEPTVHASSSTCSFLLRPFFPSSSFFLCCQPHILKIVCNQLWYISSPPTTIWCYNKHNMHVGMCSPFWVTVLIRVDRLQTLLLLPLHLPLCLYRQALFPPFLLSSTFDANYTICPPFVSWDLATSVLSPSLSTFTHRWVQAHIHVLLFPRCATTHLTVPQTSSLSNLLSGLKAE